MSGGDSRATAQTAIAAADGADVRAAPDALLLLAPGCVHCAGALQAIGTLVKEGVVGRLEVVTVAVHAEAAARCGVSRVPWLRIGRFRFDGAMPVDDLRRWAQRAADPYGMADYFLEMLKSGRRRHVEALIREDARHSLALLDLLRDTAASMAVRLGIGAVLESLQGSDAAYPMVAGLGELTRTGDARLRADACHYLTLIGAPQVMPLIQSCLRDSDAEVREIAAEALAAGRGR